MNFTYKQACALIRLNRQIAKIEWVEVTEAYEKELGSLIEEMPMYYEGGGVRYFDYPNRPDVIDGMLIDLMKELHRSMKSYGASEKVIFK